MAYIAVIVSAVFIIWIAMICEIKKMRLAFSSLLIIIALFYVYFSLLSVGVDKAVLIIELLSASAFIFLAYLGLKISLWFIVIGLILHGFYDVFHEEIFSHSVVPPWWPEYCLSFDIKIAFYVVLLLFKQKLKL